MLRIPHCLDNRLKDRGKVVSPAHRQRSSSQKQYFHVSGTHFYYSLSELQVLVRPEGLGTLKEFIHLIGSLTPRPSRMYHSALTTTLPRAPFVFELDC
jgi:hypothetical protein